MSSNLTASANIEGAQHPLLFRFAAMNQIKIPPSAGYLIPLPTKMFLNWAVDQWGFWDVEVLVLD